MKDKMMKTPEQEFLKALAVGLIDHKHFLEDKILNVCKKYLASLEQNQCDITEKVEPTWTLKVGRLYRRKSNKVVITELTFLDNENNLLQHKIIGYDYSGTLGYHEDYIDDFIKEYEPIAELEGLKKGDYVYSLDDDGKFIPWLIAQGRGNKDSLFCRCGWQVLSVKHDGQPVFLGNGQQLFWRTADRAKRFGKSAG